MTIAHSFFIIVPRKRSTKAAVRIQNEYPDTYWILINCDATATPARTTDNNQILFVGALSLIRSPLFLGGEK